MPAPCQYFSLKTHSRVGPEAPTWSASLSPRPRPRGTRPPPRQHTHLVRLAEPPRPHGAQPHQPVRLLQLPVRLKQERHLHTLAINAQQHFVVHAAARKCLLTAALLPPAFQHSPPCHALRLTCAESCDGRVISADVHSIHSRSNSMRNGCRHPQPPRLKRNIACYVMPYDPHAPSRTTAA